jgi:A1 cistron-splicing factor AAR2
MESVSSIQPISKRFYPEDSTNTIFFSNFSFTPVEIKKQYKLIVPQKLSQICRDRSQILQDLLKSRSESEILSEVSISYVLFLIGRDYRGFDQWKKLIHLFCNSDLLVEKVKFCAKFLEILHFQLKRAPDDFFIDDITNQNFLIDCLRSIFEICNENNFLKESCASMRRWLEKKFGMSFAELDDEFPIVVGQFNPEELE